MIEIDINKNTAQNLYNYAHNTLKTLNINKQAYKLDEYKHEQNMYVFNFKSNNHHGINILTTNGQDIASITINGDIKAGINFINSFAHHDTKILPQLDYDLQQGRVIDLINHKHSQVFSL